MITSIKQWFLPPVFEGDDKKNYRVKLLNVTINLSVCFLVLVVVGNLLDSSTPPRNFVIDFIFIGMFLFLRRLLFADWVKLVGYLILISAGILLTVSVSSEGTILAPATALFSLLVIMSGFIFNLRGIITATIISSLMVAGLMLAHQAGILPPHNFTESPFQWFMFTIAFGLTGWLAYFYNQLTDQALERSRMEIHEREHAEVELRKLTRAVEQSPASIIITDLDGKIEYVNPRFTQVTGYSFDEAIGKNPRILKTDKTPPETYRQLWDTLAAGKEWRGEFINRKKDGSLYTEFANISRITDFNGVATHCLAVKEDITELKQVEEKLRVSESRNRAFLSAIPDLIFRMDNNGTFLDYRDGSDAFFYVAPETIIGTNVADILPNEIAQTTMSAIQKALETNQPQKFQYELQTPSGIFTYDARVVSSNSAEVIVVAHDITEASRLEQMKTDFINRASHELRTPLTTALLMITLLEGGGTAEEQRKFLDVLKQELTRQRDLINDLLVSSRIEDKKIEVHLSSMDVIPLIKDAISSVRPLADARQISIQLEDAESLPFAFTDPQALLQVLLNLLSNAIKFSQPDSVIEIVARNVENSMMIAVQDHGIGIPVQDLPHISGRFFRAQNATQMEIQGSGIGLYIIKKTMESLEGRMEISSVENQGTTITIFIPIHADENTKHADLIITE